MTTPPHVDAGSDPAGPEAHTPAPRSPAGRDADPKWRLLAQSLMDTVEQERQRVAARLNGDLEPLLISLKLRVEDGLRQLAQGSPEAASRLLEGIPQTLRELVDDLRNMADALRPRLLDERGLVPALDWLAGNFAREHPAIGLVRRLTVPEHQVPPALKLDIYRMAEEALRNVAVHSGASWVRLGLYREGDTLHFVVEDNGIGFVGVHAGEAPPGGSGLGLARIRRHAQSTGGRLAVKSVRRQGTLLRVQWPLDPPKDVVSN